MRMRTFALVAAAGLAVACASQKGPAEAALKAAQTAFDAAKAEATSVVPDQAKAVEDALGAAQETFNKGDYQAALTAAQEVGTKVADLQQAIAAKKTELTKEWTEMSASLPGMLEPVKKKVEELSKARRLPKGMDKEKLESAKSGLEMMEKDWAEAQAASGAGNVVEAASKGKLAKDKLAEVMAMLGMPMPEAAAAEAK